MTSLPFQKHPFDQAGKVFVNKEWYLALLSLVTTSNGGGGGGSVDDLTLLEAIDAYPGTDGEDAKSISALFNEIQTQLSLDATERIAAMLRQLEILVALIPESQELTIKLIDEKGSAGTPGFASGTDFVGGTTTQLTLSQNYGSSSNIWVAFDAGMQGPDQYSLSGKTLTFTSAIPLGTSKVFVKGFLLK